MMIKRLIATSIFVLASVPSSGCYQESIRTSNEAGAILNLKAIQDFEAIKRNETKKYVTLDQLYTGTDSALSPANSNPSYRFEIRLKDGGNSFEAHATPTEYGKTGRRSFYCTEKGLIHGADKQGGEASADDPEIK